MATFCIGTNSISSTVYYYAWIGLGYSVPSTGCALTAGCSIGTIAYGGPGNAGGATGTNAATVINDALTAIGGTGNLIIAPGSNITLTATITVGGSQIHKGAFIFSGAILSYTGTATALSFQGTGDDLSFQLQGGIIQAKGSAITSTTAIGLDWEGFHSAIPYMEIKGFQKGTGLRFIGSSNVNSFDNLQIQDCGIGISTNGQDTSDNHYGQVNIKQLSSAVSGAIGFKMTTGSSINQVDFSNFNYDDNSGNPSTAIFISSLTTQLFFGAMTMEWGTSSNPTAFNINGTSSGIIKITPAYTFSETGGGTILAIGTGVNIASTDAPNLLGTQYLPSANAWTFGSATGAVTNIVGMPFQSIKLSAMSSGANAQLFTYYWMEVSPRAAYDIGFSFDATHAGQLIAPKFHVYGTTLNQLTDVFSNIAFKALVANTTYYVRLPVGIMDYNAMSAVPSFVISGTPSGVNYISTPEIFGIGIRPSVGLIGNFINPKGFDTNPSIGLNGTSSTIAASTAYFVTGVPILLTCSGGTGVSITVQDRAGNTIASGLTTISETIYAWWKVNFGAFSGAPTCTVAGE
ncbi:MAG: hypothetical protein KGI38_11510 [Thaumarchaeota archaeon]|nr:hypothetical protein [Nitrososphaerota archaeon]